AIKSKNSNVLLRFKKFSGKFNHLSIPFSLPKISPCYIDNALDFRKENLNENLIKFTAKFFETE
ncbi:MAG: hypothetical protein KDK71_06475, partial [Chlamydiia bacterium]|nr:hypothetical protein [Chlamydiia bacterium]